MRQAIAFVVMLGCFAAPMAASQARAGAAAGTGRISACSLLTKELAEKYYENKKLLPYLKPEETPVGAKGSMCEYGDVTVQVDPFPRPDDVRKSAIKDGWEKVTGVGDDAYFRNNKDRFANLMVWTGAHHLMIEMTVHDGSTGAKTKPDTIAVANAIIPKLK